MLDRNMPRKHRTKPTFCFRFQLCSIFHNVLGQGYIIVLCLFVWCVILSEDCDFWWFQLEEEIEENDEDC